MAKNESGFIQKKYRQPNGYRLYFDTYYTAMYYLANGTTLMVEARPHFLTTYKLGAKIEDYQILVQMPDHRKVLASGLKTQKAAMEKFEQIYSRYSNL